MVPPEVQSLLEGLIGSEYARYVVLMIFISSFLLVRIQPLRDLWLDALPRRRREQEEERRLQLAQRLCDLQEKQAALGLSLVDVKAIWRSRFPEALAERAAPTEAPKAVRSPGRLLAYAFVPWLFSMVYGLTVASVVVGIVGHFLVLDAASESRLNSSGALAFLIASFGLVIWAMIRVSHGRWERGYFAVMGSAFARILWGGLLYIPPLTGLFYVLGVDV